MAATAATAALTSKYLAFKSFCVLEYVMSYGRAYRERDLSRKVSAFAPNSKAKYVKPRQKACSVALWVSKLSYMDDFWEDEI